MGGFWADTVGIKAAIASFLPLGALLMCFGAQSVALYAVGTLLFNTSMPVTLFMAIRALPRWRNAAFGHARGASDGGLRSGDVGRAVRIYHVGAHVRGRRRHTVCGNQEQE